MMTRFGYEVILYAGHNNEAECAEHVKCHNSPKSTDFFVPPWTQEYFQPMNKRVIAAMRKRIKPGDLILLSMGVVQLPIQNAFPENISVEFCVGYGGSTSPARVFPSEAWRHVLLGKDAKNVMVIRGMCSHVTIPHFLDPELFPKGNGGDYLLFVGRMGGLKGEQIAIQVSQETGIPLKLVGPDYHGDYGEYLGVVKPKERAELMGGALALVAPSQFPEPFGLVAIEAQMCGTPVITTDWGAFTETVEQGVTGYRCSIIPEFKDAVYRLHEQHIGTVKVVDRDYIRRRALRLYSIDAIAPQYDNFFKRLQYI
jgi:glycosyltransferase involved in cell wall biosynthesis